MKQSKAINKIKLISWIIFMFPGLALLGQTQIEKGNSLPIKDSSRSFFQPPPFFPHFPMSIFITGANINGENLPLGAEIGVFDIDPNDGSQVCVGAATVGEQFVAGSYVKLLASKNDGSLPGHLNGFIQGNDLIFKYFVPSLGIIESVNVSFPFAGYDYSFTSQGLAFVTLSATVPTTLYNVEVTPDPSDGGLTTGGGIYLEGSSITLNASANSGYRFNAWIENGQIVSENQEFSFLVTSNRNLHADFKCLWVPPVNLQAEVVEDDILLTWEPPVLAVAGEWKHWDNGTNSFAIGKTNGGTFRFAAKWDNLFNYSGWVVNKVAFFPKYDADFTLLVWIGDNATNLLVSQIVEEVVPNQWNEVFLETPVPINIFEELRVGFECSHQANEYPAGCDNGPVNTFYGDLISFDGLTWKSLKYDYNINRDWNIQVWIEHDIETKSLPKPIADIGLTCVQQDEEISMIETKPTVFLPQAKTEFLGYNIFRSDVQIANHISGTSFTDPNLPPGIYSYFVQSVFDQGLSKRTGPALAEIGSYQTIQYQMPEGWSGFSSFVTPDDNGILEIFSQIGDSIIALKDLNQYYNLTNDSLSARKGYFVKVTDTCNFQITGKTSFNRIMQLSAGWNLIPALTTVEIYPTEVAITGNFKIIIEAASHLLFWPEYNIRSLEKIQPGKAYLIFMLTDGMIEFPNFTNN